MIDASGFFKGVMKGDMVGDIEGAPRVTWDDIWVMGRSVAWTPTYWVF